MTSATNIIDKISFFIDEGVNDKGIFKAFFLAGGSGSGKGFVGEKTLLGHGLRVIDSDVGLEFLMKKAGKIDKNGELDLRDETSKQRQEREEIRNTAKLKITDQQFRLYVQGRLGIVIDGTGKSVVKVLSQKEKLESLGYDTAMIFVKTSLETARLRNSLRPRKVPLEVLQKSWMQANKNVDNFRKIFGSNFYLINNDNAKEDEFHLIWKKIGKIINKKIHNPIALKWIKANR